MLHDEHGRILELFRRVSSPDEDRREILKQLVQLSAAHVAMEKQVLVPVVAKRLEGGDELAKRLRVDHDQVERLLTLIERRKVNSPDIPDLVNQLLAVLDDHIEMANSSLIPSLRRAIDEAERLDLGAEMLSDERSLLTHPYPHLPDSGPLARASRWVASKVDSRRDDSTDIGRSAT